MWGVAKDNSLWFRVGTAGRTGEWAGDNWTKVSSSLGLRLMTVAMIRISMMRVAMKRILMRTLVMRIVMEILTKISILACG